MGETLSISFRVSGCSGIISPSADGLIYSGIHDRLSVFGRWERPTLSTILSIRRSTINLFVKNYGQLGTIIAIFALVLWGRIGFDSDRSC